MRVLIVEDETAAVRNLRSLIMSAEPLAYIAGITDSVEGTVEWLNNNPAPEIIFMDIHLADGDAFSVFDRVKIASPVIFTTAYDKYALDAFRVNSIDYLLKPIRPDDMIRALDKFRRLTRIELDSYLNNIGRAVKQVTTLKNFLIPVKDKILLLALTEIAFLHTSEDKVTAYTFDCRHFLLDKSLDVLSTILPENHFFRANRQFIIARNSVTDLTIWYGNRLAVNLSVTTPERIIISKIRVPLLKRWLTGHA